MKVLVVKTSALGDIVHTFNALDELPVDATIDWVVERPFASLVRAHPRVSKVIEVDTKRWRKSFYLEWGAILAFRRVLRSTAYDLCFDLQGNTKSGFITFWARARKKIGFGRASVPEWPNYLVTNERFDPPKGKNIRDDYRFILSRGRPTEVFYPVQLHAEEEVPELPKGAVLVCPGSNWPNKQMDKRALEELLRRFGRPLFITQSCVKEKAFAESLDVPRASVLPKLSLPVLQNLMARVSLVIAMDSLPLHLAGMTSTPTLSVFGPSLADKYRPQGDMHYAFQGACPYGRRFEKRCPILRKCSTGACIKSLSGDTVFEAYMESASSRVNQ